MFYSKTICVPDYRNKILHFEYYVSLEDKLALIAVYMAYSCGSAYIWCQIMLSVLSIKYDLWEKNSNTLSLQLNVLLTKDSFSPPPCFLKYHSGISVGSQSSHKLVSIWALWQLLLSFLVFRKHSNTSIHFWTCLNSVSWNHNISGFYREPSSTILQLLKVVNFLLEGDFFFISAHLLAPGF